MPHPQIEARLLAAHAEGDKAALAALYAEAARASDDPEARAFFLTHAYIFALDAGCGTAEQFREELVVLGRERD